MQNDSPVAVEIHRGRRHLVVRVDRGDGRAQIRKTVRPRASLGAGSERLRHEYAVLRVLDAGAVSRVPRPLALEEIDQQPTLILEDAGPRNLVDRLRQRALPIDQFLDLACQLAEIVADLHRHRVIHRDINPSNVVVAADGRSLTLVDFGLATHVVAVPRQAEAGELVGTLPYLAPEQTGRVERALDHRADLYSLGATFYEMLTGVPPFQCDDPAELVHAHLAWSPAPPRARNPAVPEVLSDIVLRLLAKMPEQRYQSGEALLSDLREARRQWESGGAIAPFELGRFDIAQGLLAPGRLHGRQAELAELAAAFERAWAGQCELVLLSGPAGIGKSRLAAGAGQEAEGRGRFLSGKSDPLHGNLPYGALAGPLRSFFQGVLREPAHAVDRWRARVVSALGPAAGLVSDLIPELRLLVGDTALPPSASPTATENRVRLAMQALVQALAEGGEPLILFLDDLHWADPSSLALVERLVTAPDAHHLLVVAACRSDGSAGERAVARTLEAVRGAGGAARTIAVGPLDVEDVTHLCAEALRCTPEVVRPLAEVVLRKTAGSPFFVERFLRLLQRSGLLVFDDQRGTWRWDLAGAEALANTENVVDLMVDAVSRQSADTAALLAVAACTGARVDLPLLAAVIGDPIDETARRLWGALREGLLVPARGPTQPAGTGAEDVTVARYRFAHDRVRQAAYAQLDESARKRTHLAIGRRLRERWTPGAPDEELFELADQLNRGMDLLVDGEERVRLAELDLRAAERARTSGSLAPALEYARAGIAALPPESRAPRRPLWLALHRAAAEAAFFTGDGAAGEAMFEQAVALAETALEKADLYAARVSAEHMRGALQVGARWGREGLRLLGHALPDPCSAEQLAAEVEQVRERLQGRSVAGLVDLPAMRDPRALAAMELLYRMASGMQLWDFTQWMTVQTRMVALSLEHGNAPASAGAYVDFGVVLLEVAPADAEVAGGAFGRLGVELARRLRDPGIEGWVLTAFSVVSNHWHASLRENIPVVRRAVQASLEAGEFLTAGYASAALVSHLFHSGVELARVESECAAAARLMQKTGQGKLLGYLEPYRTAIMSLQSARAGGSAPSLPVPGLIDHPMNIVAPCVLRDRAEMKRRFREQRRLFELGAGLRRTIASPWVTFYSALVAAALLDEGGGEDAAVLRDSLERSQAALAGWAEHGPQNFAHRAALVAAEIARLDGRALEALALYDRAIAAARRQQFLHEEALACELAGRCRLAAGMRQTAGQYLQEARAAYARWGAAAKVEALDEELGDLVAAPPGSAGVAGATTTEDAGMAALDLQSLLKATETLSSEVVLDRLLQKLIGVCLEVAGARRGALVLEEGGRLELRAQGAVAQTVALEPTALGASERVPRGLIEEAFSRGEAVAVGEGTLPGTLGADPYFAGRAVKSALAVPIRRHGRAVGVLYLENDLAAHAFPPERVRVLGLLSSQIAISLENSRLFEDLKVEVADRTRAEQAVRFLAEASAALAESLDYRTTLAEVARLAVPFLGDWCTVDVVENDGRLAAVAAVHVDPARQRLLAELRAAFPVVDDASLPAAVSLRTRAPVLIADVDEGRMAEVVRDPRHLELTRAIGARAVLAVPLTARGRPLGAITMAIATSNRRYGPPEVAMVQELARRAAIAIDNARLYQEAQQAVRLRDEFLTVASHELNTPVAALRLSVAPFAAGAQPPADTISKLLAIVDRQSERLANLIGEMLDVSRVQAGAFHMRLEPVDLAAVVTEVAGRMEGARAQARCPLDLALQGPTVGRWDRAALERVVGNLLANAFKFGGGKPVEVNLETRGAIARLVVRDRGIGIERDRLPHIFERFTRGVSAEHYGGLGLGLYIVRVIVVALGGSIDVDSTPGAGTTFTVELPRSGP